MIANSLDGISWTLHEAGCPKGLTAVTYASGKFVAVGNGGYNDFYPPYYTNAAILTSTNGNTWDLPDSGTYDNLYGVAYGNGRYLAIGYGNSHYPPQYATILTSPDGVAWTARDPGPVNTPSSAAYGNGVFVTVASGGKTYTSPDALTWTLRNYVTTSYLYDVTFGQDQFVAVGAGGSIVASADGTNWSAGSSGTSDLLSGIVYANGQYVAVGGSTVVTSPDGHTWSLRNPGAGLLSRVAYGDGLYVAVGDGYGLEFNLGTILTSPDGVTWTPHASGLLNQWSGGLMQFSIGDIVCGNGEFFATGYARLPRSGLYFLLFSPDGIHWSGNERPDGLYGLTYADGLFVAGGYTSLDGARWTANPGPSYVLPGIAYGNGRFVGVGYRLVVSSPDGVNWTVRNPGGAYTLSAVAYGRGQFVAVGENGTILQSGLPQLQLESVVMLPDGTFKGAVSGLSGVDCAIEVSTDLVDWRMLQRLATTNGSAQFNDPSGVNYHRRFYRALQEP